jgi:uncharacterized protein (DUF952 family)
LIFLSPYHYQDGINFMAVIYHITTKTSWKAAKEKGVYEAASLQTEGFIHCCELHQVRGVLSRYYAGQTGLLALAIDTAFLQCEVKYEPSPMVQELFPHIYGNIPVNAIVEEIPVG